MFLFNLIALLNIDFIEGVGETDVEVMVLFLINFLEFSFLL